MSLVMPTGFQLLDFFSSSTQLNVLLSPYFGFISFIYLISMY